MGVKKKIGKARRDKFYHLAKETGYRARSAFKLIQLNRKFGFLERSRVCIDLCAAPGGWCQVAVNYMPISSIIVGVDLVPIKPIPKVTTLVDDITSEKCRTDLKKELKHWKADVVLNDGAPNVGQNWLHDAFSQAGLTLHALKLATEFLRKGGWFITKVFRSQDYHALLWVFKQLFNKVHATKPQASRNESAEIFIVCQGFIAPDKLDPKFLDPKAVFKDVTDEPVHKINLLQPVAKKKPKAEGYQEGDYTLHHKLNVSDFINNSQFLDKLALASELVFDDENYLKHPATTAEIVECCKDIKILGKSEIKAILNWRKKLLKTFKDASEKTAEEEAPTETKPDSDEEIDQQVLQLKAEIEQEAKRKKKKASKVKAKLREKLKLNMIRPGDTIVQQDDNNLFDLERLKTKNQLDNVESFGVDDFDEPDLEWESEEEGGNPEEAGLIYDRTEPNKDAWSDGSEDEDDDNDDDYTTSEHKEHYDSNEITTEANPLLADLGAQSEQLSKDAQLWFKREAFEGVDLEADEDYDVEQMVAAYKKKGGAVTGTDNEPDSVKQRKTKKESKILSKVKSSKQSSDSETEGSEEDSSNSDSDDSNYGKLYDKKKYKNGKIVEDDNKDFEVVKVQETVPKLDAVGLAIGAKLISSKKTRRQMVDDSFNRFAFHEENLPDWFYKDEKRHMVKHVPVTKAQIQEYKERLKEINARPIKKIAEAKARKKQRLVRRLEKARKRAEALEGRSGGDGLSEKEKWNQIKSIYKKAVKQRKEEKTYVVAKKGIGRRVSRPSGVKGRFKVVDPRMKKDSRSNKQPQRKGKGRNNKRSGRGGKSRKNL